MAYQLTKELQKFIFSVLILGVLAVGVIVIISSQFSTTLDTTDAELYNAYTVYKECKECELEVCIKTKDNLCKEAVKCKTYGLIDKVEVCI